MLLLLQKLFARPFRFLTTILILFICQDGIAQTAISPTTWGGTTPNTAAGPSAYTPLPASTTPGSAVVNVSQWNRSGLNWNAGANRYNSNGWTIGASSVTAEYSAGRYLTFTVTNNTTTEIRITGVNIGTGQASGTGPTTFGLGYTIGTGGLVVFSATAAGPSPTFAGTAFSVCAGQTVTFYLCGWGATGGAGTWSINSNAAITASYITAVTASAGSNSPVVAGNPLNFTSTPTNGVSPYTYAWSGPSFASTSASPTIPSPLTTASGTYSVVVTDSWGCTALATTPVTVNPASPCSGSPASGTATPVAASFCGSGTTTLNLVGGSASSGLSYQWSSSTTNTPPGTPIPGASSTAYTISPAITATTFFWCTTTCSVSALSNISTVGTVTVNANPVVNVTPNIGNYCAGGSGVNMVASGASTYVWTPASGLSATTGSSVSSVPTGSTLYTVTGTDVNNCVATNTATVNYNLFPGSLNISPTSVNACVGSGTNLLTATGGLIGPTSASSGTINLNCDAASSAFPSSLLVNGIPSGATITSVSVTVNFTSSYLHDYVINLKAPDNSILNLMDQHTPSGTGSYTGTTISSSGTTTLTSGASPFTGSFAADAASGIGSGGYVSTITSWAGLYTVPNGTWTLITCNTYTSPDVSSLVSWSITINYSYQAPVTWAPVTNLFTDVAGTIPYTSGSATNTIYENPLSASVITYTATATNATCISSSTITATVNALPGPISGTMFVCSGNATSLSDAVAGGSWSSSNTMVASVNSSGVVTGGIAGTAVISYSNGCAPSAVATVTVVATPGSISGPSSVCPGMGITLSDVVTGGAWSSNNISVATVGTSSGFVTGGTAGVATITYSTGCGSDATATVTVIPVPGVISGAMFLCAGTGTTTLSDAAGGGVWSSNNTLVATIGSSSGIAVGGLPGNAVITYTTGCGADATTTVTSLSAPGPISGLSSVCSGSSIVLSDAVTGGSWTSSNTTVAIVGTSSGLVTGGIAGTAVITYSMGCGTDATTTVTVIGYPGYIVGGASTVCSGLSITLSDATTAGSWSSSNTSVATIGGTTGVVTGGIAGLTTITYSTGCGTAATTTITTLATPGGISGSPSVCAGFSTTLSDVTSGGTWSSNSTSIATVGSATGIVTGGVGGTATITYSTGCGSAATATITTIVSPASITGVSSICAGLSSTLSDGVSGGTWSSSNTLVAIIGNSSGLVTGGVAGVAIITYTTGCGTAATETITVIAAPASITGASSVCSGLSTSLSNAAAGGTWSSGNTSIASVGSSTGLVTGGITGATTITYATGCGAPTTATITVLSSPGVVIGALSVCSGLTSSLSDASSGGTWSSSNTFVATVVAGSGLVTGGTAGVATITYSTGCGTAATASVNVISAPFAITGVASECAGSAIILSDAITGGVWSSSNSSIASVGNSSGTVTGVVAGTATISYSTGCGAVATKTVTVIGSPATVVGPSSVCSGLNITLSDAVTGGGWISNNIPVASVSSAGVVTGGIAGTTTITYFTGCGVPANTTITVIAAPGAISGASSVCSGLFTVFTDGATGGIWSSNNTSVATVDASGNVTGGLEGTAMISYSTGCGAPVSLPITVVVPPTTILGNTFVCSGSTVMLSDVIDGGTWSSDNTSVATANLLSGNVTGGNAGTANISYSTGCGVAAVTTFTVNPLPIVPAAITGVTTICNGTATVLSDATPGGLWTSTIASIATVNATGDVTSLNPGTTTIDYTITNSCGNAVASATLIVELPLSVPAPISGPAAVCVGLTATLTDITPGGVWSSSNTTVSIISTGGSVLALSVGTTNIHYTTTNSCGSTVATATLTVDPLPAPAAIIGSAIPFCAGTNIGLSDTTPGGVWSSNITGIATVDNFGVVTGVSQGSSTIFYAVTNGCGTVAATFVVNIMPVPVIAPLIINGVTTMCVGSGTTLSDVTVGGTWSSTSTSVATVNNTGIVTGVSGGTATISYSLTDGCGSAASSVLITINAIPPVGIITGVDNVCTGHSIQLSETVTGGVWSSDFQSTAVVTSGGNVFGVAAGADSIRYTVGNVCGSAQVSFGITVLPASSGSCGTTGVNIPGSVPTELKVFPNPNSGTFIMNLLSDNDEQAQVVITNIVGERINEFTTSTNKETTVKLDRAAGVYFLSVMTAHGSNMVKVIITN